MGHEFIVSYRPKFANKDWQGNFSVNGAFNRDVLAALPDEVRQLLIVDATVNRQSILNRLGMNTFSNVLLHYKGVYQSDEDVPINPLTGLRLRAGKTISDGAFFRAGDPIWTDLNGDYVIDDKDYVFVGNSQPLFTGGFTTYIRFKNYSLNANFSMTLKRDVLNNALADRFKNYANPDKGTGALVPLDQYLAYPDAGENAEFPNPFDFLRNSTINPFRYDQSLFQEDGSYLKFNSATFSYNFDRAFMEKLKMTSARVYVSANNIYTFSKYSGPDPELVTALGRDSSNGYPNRRSITLGLSVQF